MHHVSSVHIQLTGLCTAIVLLMAVLFAWPSDVTSDSGPQFVASVAIDGVTPSTALPETQLVDPDPSELYQSRWLDLALAVRKKGDLASLTAADSTPTGEIVGSHQDRTGASPASGALDDGIRQDGALDLASAKTPQVGLWAPESVRRQRVATGLNFGLIDPGLQPETGPIPTAGAGMSSEDFDEPSVTLVWATDDERQHSGAVLMERVDFDLESLDYTISFEPARASVLGLTIVDRRHIEIYVRPDMAESEIVDVIGHEIGHAVDHMLITADGRLRWSAARGMRATDTWWPSGMASDLQTPAGDFAECVSWLLTGSPSYSAWGECSRTEALLQELIATS